MTNEPTNAIPYRHARRLATLFAAWFVPTTALDLWITWFGIYHLPERMAKFGIVEGNPYTDLSSVEAFVTPEVIVLVIGIALVFGGGVLKMRRLLADGRDPADLRRMRYWAFCSRYYKPGQFASLMILLPMAIAIGRVEPVINNVMWLAIGWGPTALFGTWSVLLTIATCTIALIPAYYMIRRWTL